MRHSFAPFGIEEAVYLSAATGIDYVAVDFTHPRWFCVTARADDGRLLGLCCFEFKRWFDAYFSIAIADPHCISRRVMRAMFTAVFSQATRVSAEVDPGNGHAIALAKRLGFEVEGYRRNAIEGVRDALAFGMTADTCRFLAAPQRRSDAAATRFRHGQLSQPS